MSKKKASFEESLKQLESLAEQIERGEIGLEESIQKYEEGVLLVRRCREILMNAERKIQALQEQEDGTLRVSAFDRGGELPSGEAVENENEPDPS